MIRPLSASDVDAFIDIRREMISREVLSFGSDPDREINREQTLKDLAQKNAENFILGAFDGETMAGMVGCLRHQRQKESHKAMIWGMYVRPDYRGRQIGRKLIEETVAKISEVEGVEKVMLSATSAAAPARALYESVGFTLYGVERDSLRWQGQCLDQYFMEYLVRR